MKSNDVVNHILDYLPIKLLAPVKNSLAIAYAHVILFSLLFIFPSCNPDKKIVITNPPPPFYFSKNWKAEISFPVGGRFVGSNYLRDTFNIYISDSTGILKFSSKDAGKIWTKPKNIFSKHSITFPVIISNKLLGVVALDEYKYGGQINYYSFEGNSFGESSPIRDSNWGTFHGPVFAYDSLDNLFCIWTDYRNGNADIYFSSSFDKGKTWNENIKINDDNSGQEQTTGNILYTQNGKLCVIWNDNRSLKNLFDLYCSSSANNGKTWSDNLKINGDSTRAWQMISSAGKDKSGNIYLAWTDYRNIGKSGDHISSIYFSKSSDNGMTWNGNIPIHTPVKGSDSYPVLVVSAEGNLNCAWQNTDDNQSNDILFSYSIDGGNNWSLATIVNDEVERARHHIAFVFLNDKRKIKIGCLDWRESTQRIYISEAGIKQDTFRREREIIKETIEKNKKVRYIFNPGKVLFNDSFERNSKIKWENNSGSWITENNTFIGYGATEAQSFAGNSGWTDYAYEGQFKLDVIDHRAAYIYFRVMGGDNNKIKYYRIKNYFRSGTKIEYFDGSALIPVAESSYPIQKERWYEYRVEVKDNRLNYFIDDSLIIASDKITKIARGKIGVGAFAAPAYFKNIKVTAIN